MSVGKVRPVIPADLPDLLRSLSFHVIRDRPIDIIRFAADHFKAMYQLRIEEEKLAERLRKLNRELDEDTKKWRGSYYIPKEWQLFPYNQLKPESRVEEKQTAMGAYKPKTTCSYIGLDELYSKQVKNKPGWHEISAVEKEELLKHYEESSEEVTSEEGLESEEEIEWHGSYYTPKEYKVYTDKVEPVNTEGVTPEPEEEEDNFEWHGSYFTPKEYKVYTDKVEPVNSVGATPEPEEGNYEWHGSYFTPKEYKVYTDKVGPEEDNFEWHGSYFTPKEYKVYKDKKQMNLQSNFSESSETPEE